MKNWESVNARLRNYRGVVSGTSALKAVNHGGATRVAFCLQE